MNFQNFNFDHVETPSSQTRARHPLGSHPLAARNTPPPTSSQITVLHDPAALGLDSDTSSPFLSSPSPQFTTVPPAPSPPSLSSESEIYGPERLFGPDNVISQPMIPNPAIRFLMPQGGFTGNIQDPTLMRDFKDELARAAGVVTPGVDDSPYIRYALDAMTRQREEEERAAAEAAAARTRAPRTPQFSRSSPNLTQPPAKVHLAPKRYSHLSTEYTYSEDSMDDAVARRHSSPGSWSPITLSPLVPLGDVEQLEAGWQRRINEPDHLEPPPQKVFKEEQTFRTPPLPVKEEAPRDVLRWDPQPDSSKDPEVARLTPPLNFKPWILRPQSFMFLMILCILMITALIFCGVYSIGRNGLTPYGGSIYGGDYFVFRVLPQLLAILILIYTQCMTTAAFRILPFSAMASDDIQQRRNAVFLPLYPRSFLWPHLVGDWHVWTPTLVAWVMNFTIPLQSCLFSVRIVDDVWTWTTVQGIVWTLVAFYVSLLMSTIIIFVFWLRRRTGMPRPWDLKTLADIIFLVAQSNSARQYHGTETFARRAQLMDWIPDNIERLGYWLSPEIHTTRRWYGIGLPSHEVSDVERMGEKVRQRVLCNDSFDAEKLDFGVRNHYLPFIFRTGPIISAVAASVVLVVIVMAVSLSRPAGFREGFLPGLSAAPGSGSFSAANFLYSFIPSLLGLVLFLAFQSLDMTLRVLTPWGELAQKEGSRAETSLLLDYAACLPWEATIKALRLRHWRVAFVSFLATLFALLPVLAGGMFMALTPSVGAVRMYPNLALFGIVLGLLFLYLFGLVSLVPDRNQFRLPHSVTCLADVISFCASDELRTDAAFNNTFTRQQLVDKLEGCNEREPSRQQARWTFGRGPAGNERLGIKRLARFTSKPRKMRRFETGAQGELIAKRPTHDSSSVGSP